MSNQEYSRENRAMMMVRCGAPLLFAASKYRIPAKRILQMQQDADCAYSVGAADSRGFIPMSRMDLLKLSRMSDALVALASIATSNEMGPAS